MENHGKQLEKQVREKFLEIFGKKGFFYSVRAPGRANLIGEHIDYQGGYVLPVAVDRFIFITGRKRTDRNIRIFSLNYNRHFEICLDEIAYQKKDLWANYILGVINELKKRCEIKQGAEMVVGGNIPEASGLSSSAALEIAAAVFFQKLFNINIPAIETVKLARLAENDFVGVSCGIMDQFSVYLSQKDHASLINCRTLKYKHIQLPLENRTFFLVDTGKKRRLSSSAYNDRVNSVMEALKIINNGEKEKALFLTDISKEKLGRYKNKLSSGQYNRARHITEENMRVLKASSLLPEKKFAEFGALMYQSHQSLKNLYEVSCRELDFIVDFSKNFKGVYGARLTGAGMGGCCIVLADKNSVPLFRESLSALYKKEFGMAADFYTIKPESGAFYINGN